MGYGSIELYARKIKLKIKDGENDCEKGYATHD